MNRTVILTPLGLALAALLTSPAHAHRFGPWGAPVPASFNTPTASEGCPIESPDGRRIYIASNRPGGEGNLDVWRASRRNVGAPWGPMENLGPTINSGDADYCPTPLRGRWLMYVSSKDRAEDCLPGPAPVIPGSPTSATAVAGDMYLSKERRRGQWSEPLHLGCYPDGPNTAGFEFSPSLVRTDEGYRLFFSSNGYPDSQGQDLYVSEVLDDGTVLPGQRIAELSTAADDRMPNVRRDGLEIVFSSNRQGFNGQDIWVATRASTADPWGAPVWINDPAINTAGNETRASLSGDGRRLYFGRDGDVFVSTRARLRGKAD
jgi:hypothetical protein